MGVESQPHDCPGAYMSQIGLIFIVACVDGVMKKSYICMNKP